MGWQQDIREKFRRTLESIAGTNYRIFREGMISLKTNPEQFVANLYKALNGSYCWAGKPETIKGTPEKSGKPIIKFNKS